MREKREKKKRHSPQLNWTSFVNTQRIVKKRTTRRSQRSSESRILGTTQYLSAT
jgi:hypothetical protein